MVGSILAAGLPIAAQAAGGIISMVNSRKRRKAQNKLAGRYFDKADELGNEISSEKSKDPFQSAGAKSTMAKASRNAKQMQQRTLNTLGAGASPEALIAQQGKTAQAQGSAAGQIATGAEAQKQANISNLRSQQASYESQAAGIKSNAINERGKGWNEFLNNSGEVGDVGSGIGASLSTLGS